MLKPFPLQSSSTTRWSMRKRTKQQQNAQNHHNDNEQRKQISYHFWIVSRLLLNGAPFPDNCCSLFHLFSSWSNTRYWSSFNWKKKQKWFKGFGLYTRCNPDLLDHVQVSVGQGGGLQFQIVELEQADLGIFRFLNQGIEIYLFCSFILFNWNTKDLGTLWGKVYYVIAPCFVNFLRTIRTNYGSNILVPKCPIQSKMLFSMIFSKMMFS